MTKLTKEEWSQLDLLLSKIGFGGYYDVMEVLRMSASNLAKRMLETEEDRQKWKKTIEGEKDLRTLILLISYLSNVVPPKKDGNKE